MDLVVNRPLSVINEDCESVRTSRADEEAQQWEEVDLSVQRCLEDLDPDRNPDPNETLDKNDDDEEEEEVPRFVYLRRLKTKKFKPRSQDKDPSD